MENYINYEVGDVLPIGEELYVVQCPIKYVAGPMAGRTLYWTVDLTGKDVLFWDRELKELGL